MFASLSLAAFPAWAASDDASAIAAFLAIGFANADTNFRAITGSQLDGPKYEALKWPDKTQFQDCHITSFPSIGGYLYVCISTDRSGSAQELFDMAAAAVDDNLPPGYARSSPGYFTDGHIEWSQSGQPYVRLYSNTVNGKASYQIVMAKL